MRLIDAEALIKEANAEGAYGYVDVIQIEKAPTIEAKPVVHAHWDNGECTNCEAFITDKNALLTPYCPFCGARMDEVVEDD